MTIINQLLDNIDLTDGLLFEIETSMQQAQFFSRQVREARRFYLDLSPAPNEALVVVSGGRGGRGRLHDRP